MHKNFEIGFTDSNGIIIYSTNYLRLEEYIKDITMILQRNSYKGDVIFDLLLCNGYSTNRFIKMLFDGASFKHKTCEVIENIDISIRDLSFDFYSTNTQYLENSILSKVQIFLIKNKYKKFNY